MYFIMFLDQEEDQSRDHAVYDGNPSSLLFAMMHFHPKLPVMDIHVPSRLICKDQRMDRSFSKGIIVVVIKESWVHMAPPILI